MKVTDSTMAAAQAHPEHNYHCMLVAGGYPADDPVCTCPVENGRMLSLEEGLIRYEETRRKSYPNALDLLWRQNQTAVPTPFAEPTEADIDLLQRQFDEDQDIWGQRRALVLLYRRVATKAVHHSDYSSQPDVRISCDQSFTTPKWSHRGGETNMPEIYQADDGRFYTFDPTKATCPSCLLKSLSQVNLALEEARARAARLSFMLTNLHGIFAAGKTPEARKISEEIEESLRVR
jgi:hypothetical protein